MTMTLKYLVVQFDGDMDKDFQQGKTTSDFANSETNNVVISPTTQPLLDNKFVAVELQKEAINKPERFGKPLEKTV
jgi:hypothetical protein